MGEALACDLDKRCEVIYDRDCEEIEEEEEEEQKTKKPSCFSVGICLCSDVGCTTYRMRNSWLVCQKKWICTDELKADVDSRRVFLHLIGTDANASTDPWIEELNILAGVGPSRPQQQIWLCIGAMSWSPYRPCFKYYIKSEEERRFLAASTAS